MQVGNLVIHKTVHEDQEKARPLIVIEIRSAWPSSREETLRVQVMDLESGELGEWYDWQVEVIDVA